MWSALAPRKRVIVVAATVAMFFAVLGLARIASTPSMALLYSGLEPASAGDVIAALEAQGAAYEVRGDAIHVPSSQRDSLRMMLAGEGLPANGAQGYELLDGLSGFGTTSQMFDAAYWRAKEGELARTIVAAPHISAARVHIGTAGSRPFSRNPTLTASVTVTTGAGTLSVPHAKALKYLVASAVAGMDPDDVSVIDTAGGLVATGPETGGPGTQDTRAADLRRNVERLLEARVGYGNAVVELSVETNSDSELITERRFDPDSRVAISTDTEERTDTATDARSGAVTVASNLPDGDASGSGQNSNSSSSESRERVNFEVSETQREISRGPGDIRRLTVAVLVDGVRQVDSGGAESWVARSDQELADLRDLVSAAVGFDESRGDTITIKSMEFEPVTPVGTVATATLMSRMAVDTLSLIQVAVLAVVALVLGLAVVRPILLSTTGAASAPALPATDRGGPRALPPPHPALTGEIDDAPDTAFAPPMAFADFGGPGAGGLPALPNRNSDPVERLRRMIEDRQEEAVELLRHWMEDREERR